VVVVLVALAAGAGAVARYLVDLAVQRRVRSGLPWGTLAVNVSGSFGLGLVAGALTGDVSAVLGAGFCGGYTTLSTLAWEALALAEDGAGDWAAANVVGSTLLGLAAAAAALALT
jgi:fluoride exporter